jgi:hypothetical protein
MSLVRSTLAFGSLLIVAFAPPVARTATGTGPATGVPAVPPPGPDATLVPMAATRAAKVLTAPAGAPVGDLAQGALVHALARERGWVRVRVEGWVQEKDLAPADTAFGAGLSAADLRADPNGTRGKLVRWEVQVLAMQRADPLRREMAPDEPYLLAKGPGSESALLYLAVPPSMLAEAKAIAPLTTVIITARVRSGRSDPVGTPVLDLQSLSRR